jgi:polysaccharide pyruvyl transferase CsaB
VRVLVAGWVGSTNLGDELALAGLRRLLAERSVTSVAAISTDPATTRRLHGIGAVSHGDVAGIWRAVGRADAVVFGGGGIVQDVTSALNLPYHLSRIVVARARRTPVAGVGLGIGGLDTTLGRQLTGTALRGLVGISVRDPASAALLAEVGVPGAVVAADLAFALPAVDHDPTGTLAVSLRAWSERRSRGPVATRGDGTPSTHVTALARALDRAVARTGLRVRFVALQTDRDDEFHARVAAEMTTPTDRVTPGLDAVVEAFADADAAVTMRYHGAVAATLAGRPTVLVSYAAKTDALALELGPGTRRLGWDLDGFAQLPDALDEVLDRSAAVAAARDRLQARQDGNRAVLDGLLAAGQGNRASQA